MGEAAKPEPWQRQDKESVKGFRAFCIYRDLGPKRSLARAFEIYTERPEGSVASSSKLSTYFRDWSKYNRWVVRAKQYDEYLLEKSREAEEKALEKVADKWAKRLEAQREQEWLMSEELMERVGEMLAAPLFHTETKKDGKTIIVMPADWRASDIVQFVKVASFLGRLAIGSTGEGGPKSDENTQKMIVAGREIIF